VPTSIEECIGGQGEAVRKKTSRRRGAEGIRRMEEEDVARVEEETSCGGRHR
jgi:hypothetical protein